MKRFLSSLIICFLMLGSQQIFASMAKFAIVPVPGSLTALLLPKNFSATISYQVTNQTKISRTLTMVPIPGVTQTVGAGLCPSVFSLGPQQSCILTLVINGSQVSSSGINGGPVVCKTKSPNDPTPDPLLCSEPTLSNTLAISVTKAGQHAYVANQLGNSVSFCQVNPATGFLDSCAVTATGLNGTEGIGFNPAKTFFYSANPLSSSVSVCPVNAATGALNTCVDSGGTGFVLPDAVTFSPDGNIFYTSDFGSNTVTACSVNATTGLLSGCTINPSPTFSAPGNMTLNAAGTIAYVVNRTANTTSVCKVSGQTVNACIDTSGSLFNAPEGVTLSIDGLHAYVANAGSRTITLCDILQDGTGLLRNCHITGGEFSGTGNIGFNDIGTLAYVPNELLSDVFVCNVERLTGELSLCIRSRGTGFSGPAGVVLN